MQSWLIQNLFFGLIIYLAYTDESWLVALFVYCVVIALVTSLALYCSMAAHDLIKERSSLVADLEAIFELNVLAPSAVLFLDMLVNSGFVITLALLFQTPFFAAILALHQAMLILIVLLDKETQAFINSLNKS